MEFESNIINASKLSSDGMMECVYVQVLCVCVGELRMKGSEAG